MDSVTRKSKKTRVGSVQSSEPVIAILRISFLETVVSLELRLSDSSNVAQQQGVSVQ